MTATQGTEGGIATIQTWYIEGDWFDNCSCAFACPCTFAEPPDNGYCESVLFWHVRRGHYGDVTLDGLSFVRVGRWEGGLWGGKVEQRGHLCGESTHAPPEDERQRLRLPLIGALVDEESGRALSPKGGRCGAWTTRASRSRSRPIAPAGAPRSPAR